MQKQRFKPTRIILFALGALLLTGVLLVVLEKTHVTDFVKAPGTSNKTTGPTKAQQEQQAKTDAKAKQDYLDSVTKSNSSSSDTGSSSTDNSADTRTLTVSASQSGSTVTVLTQMQGVPAGSCKLTATRGGSSTTQTAQIIYQPEFSSCAGFSISTGTLGAGTWDISVTATPDSGVPLTKSTSLEVK